MAYAEIEETLTMVPVGAGSGGTLTLFGKVVVLAAVTVAVADAEVLKPLDAVT